MNEKSNVFHQTVQISSQPSGELTYISSMLDELKVMADRSGYKFLFYLIDMAEMHALELASKQQALSINKTTAPDTNNN